MLKHHEVAERLRDHFFDSTQWLVAAGGDASIHHPTDSQQRGSSTGPRGQNVPASSQKGKEPSDAWVLNQHRRTL